MAAKDYEICCAMDKVFIGKQSKRHPDMMTGDRRELTDSEILMLIDWFCNKTSDEGEKGFKFDSHAREGMELVFQYQKK